MQQLSMLSTPTSPPPLVHLAETVLDAEFETWYAAYPRRKGRGAALLAFKRARRKASMERLMAGARKAARLATGRDPTFIPYPATWLNQERWDDEDDAPPCHPEARTRPPLDCRYFGRPPEEVAVLPKPAGAAEAAAWWRAREGFRTALPDWAMGGE